MMHLVSILFLLGILCASTRSQVKGDGNNELRNDMSSGNRLLKELQIGIDQPKSQNIDKRKTIKNDQYKAPHIQNLETGQFQIVSYYYCQDTQTEPTNQTLDSKKIKIPLKSAVYYVPRPGKQNYFYKPHNYSQLNAILTIAFIKDFFEKGPGIQFKIVPKYNQSTFQAVFMFNQTMQWTTIRINYLINSRNDLFCGNYEPSNKRGLQINLEYKKYYLGYDFKKEQLKLRLNRAQAKPNIITLISGLKSNSSNFSAFATQQNDYQQLKSSILISSQFNLLNEKPIISILISFIVYLPNQKLTIKTIPVGVQFHRYTVMEQAKFRPETVVNLGSNDGGWFLGPNLGFQDRCNRKFMNKSDLYSSLPSSFYYYQLTGMISYNGSQFLQSLDRKRDQDIQKIQPDSISQEQIDQFTRIFQIQQIRFLLRPYLKVYSQRYFSNHDPFVQNLIIKNQPIRFEDCAKYKGFVSQDRKQNGLCVFCNRNQVFNQKCQKCQCMANFVIVEGQCRNTRELCEGGFDMVYRNGKCFRSVHVQVICQARFRRYNNITRRCQGCMKGFIQPTSKPPAQNNNKTQCIPSCPDLSYMDPQSLRCKCTQGYYMINNTCRRITCGKQYEWNIKKQRCQCKEQSIMNQINGECVKCSPYEKIKQNEQEKGERDGQNDRKPIRRFCVAIQSFIVNRSDEKDQKKKN